MFKSKIFNSVMRYMLVAMLALLPNAIWAGDNYMNNVFLTDVNRVSIDMQSILGGNDNKAKYNYIEFYFLDKSDAIVDLSNIKLGLWNSESNDANSDFNGGGFKKTNNYFLFYKEKNGWGCENLFRFKINTTGVNLSGYKFVVKASNTNNFETDKTTADVTYTYQLYSQSDVDAVTFTKATDPTLVKSAYALKEGNKCILSGASVYDEIKKILEVSSKEDIKDFYIRWTIKHTDNTKVDNLTVSSEKIKKRNDLDYIYYNNTGSSIQAKDLDVTLELPSSESWDNIKLSFVISKNISELTTQYGVVEKEPTLNALYNITLETKYSMPFKHYVGHANTAFDEKGKQQTAEWEYYVYVKDANEQVELVLPFDKYENGIGSGTPLEPRGYFRWYDFKTDKANDNLSPVTGTGASTLLNHIVSGSNDYGLFAFNISQDPVSKNVGVTYTAPAGASSEGWVGEDIACDVSRYIDGLDATKTYLVHEPTLSIRYIFHIRSAKQLADDIMNTAIGKNPQRAGYRTYEDGKYITVGMKDASSTVTLRLDLSDATKYYFHPLADGVYKQDGASFGFTNRVYYVDEKYKLVESNFDKNKLCKATKIEWWAYDKTKTYCRNLGTETNRFFDLSMGNLNGSWMPASMTGSDKNFSFNYGDPVFIVAYAMDDDGNRCPIANFDVRFMNNHPMTKEEIVKNGLNNRLISYLDEHYKMATKPITFDDDDVEQTVAAPTSPDDNQDRLPSKWDRRAYSFVYRDLIDYDATYYGLKKIGHSPLHGDYCLYKSANVDGVSGNGESLKDGYLWWQSGQLYDKTYEITNGSQYGHFLYVDASDESRKIAAADFTADLCTGQQLIFTAGVADMTKADTRPQIMFKLFGVKRNVNDDIVEKHLIHSFASGDFKTNVEKLQTTTWYQVYGKITLQKESNVEQYSDFRLEIDNYCSNTDGADYAVDDIRMYLAPAKVQVIQEKPACGGATTGTVKLKIRAIHETLNAILGHKDTKIYFRFVGEDGKPVEGTDESNPYYRTEQVNTSDGTKIEYKSNKYGAVDVFDSEETCNQYTIDGTPMIEKDSEGETYIVISNRYYPLEVGKKYYVSVATETPDATGNSNWGTPAEVCSLYSNWFEMVSQHPIITDTKGNIVTDYKIPCDQADNYEVKIKGQLTTTDPYNGGKITLDGVKFIWYIDGTGETNKVDPSAPASNEITISKDKLTLGTIHNIYMLPEGTQNNDYIEYTAPNGKKYLLCPSAIPVPLRVMKDGPQLNFGFNDVDYPFNDGSYEASLRIGLPQLEKLKASKGYLKVPLHSATMRDGTAITEPLTFIDDSKAPAVNSKSVIVASTNDPLWEKKLNQTVATLENEELPAFNKTTQATLNLKFEDNAVANFHEGYYYVLRFAYEKRAASAATTNCPGESYLKVKIVPEFITWTPTADGGMNANWNNDDNWHRSSSTELHDNEYTNYLAYGNASGITAKVNIPTLNSYVPMKFTKVTIGNLNGLPFPDLGNVVYRSTNQIATKLTNGKGNEATKYIQYDIMAYWDETATNKGLGTDGNLKCEKFYGNTCHQIYFKPQGELRDQCYLVYDKAWVEKELVPNKWYTMASPLQYIYAGDMYVPAIDGQQTTKAFTDIKFDDKAADGTTAVYSRSKYPVYQRAWMKSGVEEISPKGDYSASHYPDGAAPGDVDMNLGYWSHVYNKVDESYAAAGTFGGFSIKAGNALLPKRPTDGTPLPNAILRLPKADTSYQYYDYDGTTTSGSKKGDVTKPDVSAIVSSDKNSTGHGKLLVAFNNDEKHPAQMVQELGTDNNSGFYLVANPYTCSISLKKFFEANTGLQNAIWIVENGDVKAISSTEPDKQNYAIQPTQSFFVKKNVGATITEVKFTSTMCVDRTITPGLLMASDYVKSIEATTENSNGQTSRARIALRPEASADYDDQEDVDLLYDQNLKDVPQVYTVAGNEAVAVNAVPELSWIPLGIVSQQAEEVSLTLKGVNKLDAPVYLYDAASASFTELHEGEAVKVKAGDHGRYFLTQTRTSTGIDRMETEEQSAPVKVYSPAPGMIVVSALGGEKLDRVQVFTLDGKMVHSYQLPAKQRMILRVPSGIYIVKASTQSCAQAKGQKISVR